MVGQVNVILFDTNETRQRSRGRAEVRSGVVRRRRWRAEEKGRIVAQAIAPGGLTPQQLSNWIKAAKEGRVILPAPELSGDAEDTGPDFVPVVAVQAREAAGADTASYIEIVAGNRRR